MTNDFQTFRRAVEMKFTAEEHEAMWRTLNLAKWAMLVVGFVFGFSVCGAVVAVVRLFSP